MDRSHPRLRAKTTKRIHAVVTRVPPNKYLIASVSSRISCLLVLVGHFFFFFFQHPLTRTPLDRQLNFRVNTNRVRFIDSSIRHKCVIHTVPVSFSRESGACARQKGRLQVVITRVPLITVYFRCNFFP